MARKTHHPHPGRVIELEFMEPYGLSMYRLAQLLDVSESRIQRLIHGETRITPDLAKRLTQLFGMSDQTWLNLQSHYDLATEDHPTSAELKKIAARRRELRVAA